MVMDASTTQIPVEDGDGAKSLTAGKCPLAGTRVPGPPLPESLITRDRSRRSWILGASWKVVAMRNSFSDRNFFGLRFLVCRLHLFGGSLHHVVANRTLDAVLVRIMKNFRQFVAKVIVRRRCRRRAPLQGRGLPRVGGRDPSPKSAMDQVVQKYELSQSGQNRSHRDEPVQGDQRLGIVVDESLVAADASCNSQIGKRHKDAIGTDKGEPEVNLAQSFAHHATKHLGKPEISSSENTKDGCYPHHQMKVSDYEVGGVQHNVDRRLRQEETAYPATDKHRDKA